MRVQRSARHSAVLTRMGSGGAISTPSSRLARGGAAAGPAAAGRREAGTARRACDAVVGHRRRELHGSSPIGLRRLVGGKPWAGQPQGALHPPIRALHAASYHLLRTWTGRAAAQDTAATMFPVLGQLALLQTLLMPQAYAVQERL